MACSSLIGLDNLIPVANSLHAVTKHNKPLASVLGESSLYENIRFQDPSGSSFVESGKMRSTHNRLGC